MNRYSAQSYALGCSELCNRGQSHSENRSFGLGIHDVPEKGRGAARKLPKSALKTMGNVLQNTVFAIPLEKPIVRISQSVFLIRRSQVQLRSKNSRSSLKHTGFGDLFYGPLESTFA